LTYVSTGECSRQVLAARRRDAVVTVAVLALTAAAFAAVADHGLLAHLQRADDAWLRLMISGRSAPVTAVAKVFNWLGLVYVTLPVRIGIAGFLALRRRWWHLAAFAAAVVLSEVLIGTLKGAVPRLPRGALAVRCPRRGSPRRLVRAAGCLRGGRAPGPPDRASGGPFGPSAGLGHRPSG